jgi:CHAT domain-containing protein
MSLWAVDHGARMKFMKQVYHLALNSGMSYSMAITAAKRAFIKGMIEADSNGTVPAGTGEYKNPYFWGAFIYYGN